MKNKKNLKWRKLDNSAKIFPIISNKKFSTVFRISAILKENIDENILKQAVDKALLKFSSFKVLLKKGFFWYYLEANTKEPIIEIENNYPCKYIDKDTNNGYLFKVTYFNQKINLDVFHSLTDGNSAIHFLKEIVYTYIELKYPNDFSDSKRSDRKMIYTTDDAYMKNYDKKAEKALNSKKAYILKGKKLPLDAISVVHGIIDVEKLREIAKQKGATVTQYLTSVLIYSIYKANYIKNNGKKPIKICIPVNLKKYFQSITISNFFSYITVAAQMGENNLYDLDGIIEFVKKDFTEKLTEKEIIKTMSSNVKLGNNIFIRLIPLFLKKFTVKISYIEIRKYTTTTFSNIGRVGIIAEYKKYIDNFMILLAPEIVEKIKCSACSYENKLVFTFTSILTEKDIQNKFFDILKQNGINVKIETNGV